METLQPPRKQDEVKIFNNKQFGTIRTLNIENEPWFVGKDVAEILGYSNASKAVSVHVDTEDKQFIMLDIAHSQNGNAPIGQSKTAVINESGLYSLILSSKLPSAKEFKRWVTSDVLPSIRKTGGYVANEEQFVETYLPFADDNTKTLFKMTLDVVKQLNRRIEQQEEKITNDKPKVDFADKVTNADNCIDVGTLAKLAYEEHHLNIGRNRLYAWLREKRYIRSSGEPYQTYIDKGLFSVKEYTYKTYCGVKTGIKTLITGKGQVYLMNVLQKEWNSNAAT